MIFKNLFQISILILACALIPLGAGATSLYFESTEASYQEEDTFLVEVRIEVEEECINTISANMDFPKDLLEAIDFSQGDSILSIWVDSPDIKQDLGLISFSGGIPGGYCGLLLGDPGESNLLGRIIFKVKPLPYGPRSAKIGFLDNSEVLANDGFGTPVAVGFDSLSLQLLPKTAETTKEEWQEALVGDKTSPEDFTIIINQDPSIFDGKYFIVFSTTDKQTGVDHYQVKEGSGDWQIVESPYVLEDQELQSIILVRAIDKAGNERASEYNPKTQLPAYLIVIVFLIVIAVAIFVLRRKK